MNIPEKPQEIIRFIILVFIIGLIIVLPINLITDLSIWANFEKLFTPDAWGYIRWWLNIFPEPAAGFLAIYAAFALERRKEERDFLQRVREIIPYIYFELLENKSHIEDFINNQTGFIEDDKQFNNSNWEMFKDDIKKWQEQNVVPLTRIYFCLSYINRKIENTTLVPNDYTITSRVKSSYNLIKKQLELYDINFFNDEKNYRELRNVSEIYYETSLMDEDLQTVLQLDTHSERLKIAMQNRVLDILIKQLSESRNYATANRIIKMLKEYDSFSENQVNNLLFWYLNNDQISGSIAEKSFLRPLFDKYKGTLDTDLINMYDIFVKNDYRPTHRTYIFEIIKEKILPLRPDLTIESLNNMIQKEVDSKNTHIYGAIKNVIKELEISISVLEEWRRIIT